MNTVMQTIGLVLLHLSYLGVMFVGGWFLLQWLDANTGTFLTALIFATYLIVGAVIYLKVFWKVKLNEIIGDLLSDFFDDLF